MSSDDRDPYEILQVQPSALPQVVEAAYRALAQLQHPDRTGIADDARSMADLNWAYAILRDPEQRIAYDQAAVPITVEADEVDMDQAPAGPTLMERVQGVAAAAVERDTENPGNVTLDFGRYAGMTLAQIMRIEPGYLEWLRRHSSGLRYRPAIDAFMTSLAARRASASAE